MMKSSVSSCSVIKARNQTQKLVTDLLAVEEPLEIILQYGASDSRKETTLAITMRTPGHDKDLVAGFLVGEGLVNDSKDILSIRPCLSKENKDNTIKVHLAPHVPLSLDLHKRHVYVSSSCGVCGRTSMEAISTICPWPEFGPGPAVSKQVLHALPSKLQELQLVFYHTGGLHAAALFHATGEPLIWKEDVGRHNALDKVIGAAFQQGMLPLKKAILLLSGRISFELVQKAIMSGITFIAAMGAPSNLAVELAEKFDITLVGFLNENRFNVYHGAHRILDPISALNEDQDKRK